MTIQLEKIRTAFFKGFEYDSILEYDNALKAVEEDEERISSPEFIIEWFNSPFISDFDKKKALQEINKLKI
jgi:hypothetical protein